MDEFKRIPSSEETLAYQVKYTDVGGNQEESF